ncbi:MULTISPECIES: WXG100 family type VII secretion target [unclassified Micromonospora]|uniref:WXG100 family type VII secretion target n=1 Tax=unclassified Micromonospora TaxID=2617518 RepID=UPI003A85F2B8
MTMPVVQTTDPGMQAAATEFAAKTQEFTGHLRSVNTQMTTLQASWRGDASNSFNQAMDNWERSFQTVINELMHMMDVMGVTTAGYRAAEDDASQAARDFGAALPGI